MIVSHEGIVDGRVAAPADVSGFRVRREAGFIAVAADKPERQFPIFRIYYFYREDLLRLIRARYWPRAIWKR